MLDLLFRFNNTKTRSKKSLKQERKKLAVFILHVSVSSLTVQMMDSKHKAKTETIDPQIKSSKENVAQKKPPTTIENPSTNISNTQQKGAIS